MDRAFVERADELARLQAIHAAAAAQGGRVVLVTGEAGIGKSELVRQFLARIPGVSSHVGRCDDLATPMPLAPIHDIARDVPRVAAALSARDRGAVRDAVLGVLGPRDLPAVLVIEDLHWADEATLDVVAFLGRRIMQAGGVLVLTWRDTEIHAHHPLSRVLASLPPDALERVALKPLSIAAVSAIAGGDRNLGVRVRELTGGNPLFVTEVLREGKDMLREGEDVLPSSVADGVQARLARMSIPVRDVLASASLVPGTIEWDLWDALCASTPDALEEGTRNGLLVSGPDGVAYRHELLRRAVAASLDHGDRRRRHARMIGLLGPDADAARLVHHAVGADDDNLLLAHTGDAARAAAEASSHREACAHFRRLAPWLDRLPRTDAASLAEEWGQSAVRVDVDEAVTAVTRAVSLRRGIDDPAELARTLSTGAFVMTHGGDTATASTWAAEAVELAEVAASDPVLARALVEQARTCVVSARVAEGIDAAVRAQAVAERVGSHGVVTRAMLQEGDLRFIRGDHDDGAALVEEAGARAARAGDSFAELDSMLIRAWQCKAGYDDLPRAADLLQRACVIADDHENDNVLGFARAQLAEVQAFRGDWQHAEATCAQVLAASPAPDTATTALRVLATVAVRRGSPEVDTVIRRMWDSAVALGDNPRTLAGVAAITAECMWLTGARHHAHLPQVEHVLRRRLDGPSLRLDDDLVFWMWKLGRLPAVPADLVEGYRRIIDGDATGAGRYWHARGMTYQRGLALLHGSDDDLLHGLRLLEGMGAEGAARRARAHMRERGTPAPRGRSRAARDHPAGLTPRQAEVLGLLADGMSNAEIAERLVISHRTVEGHVAGILRALGVETRQDAVATATRRGLVEATTREPS